MLCSIQFMFERIYYLQGKGGNVMAQKNVRCDYFETWIREYDKETNAVIQNKGDITDLFEMRCTNEG